MAVQRDYDAVESAASALRELEAATVAAAAAERAAAERAVNQANRRAGANIANPLLRALLQGQAAEQVQAGIERIDAETVGQLDFIRRSHAADAVDGRVFGYTLEERLNHVNAVAEEKLDRLIDQFGTAENYARATAVELSRSPLPVRVVDQPRNIVVNLSVDGTEAARLALDGYVRGVSREVLSSEFTGLLAG